MAELRFADVAEGVRRTIAAYAQALDDGRTADVVATFCPDATIDLPGQGVFEGLDAIAEAFAAWVPRQPQRHLVLNTQVLEWDDERAHAVSDLVLLLKGEAGWSVQLVGRYDDMLRNDGSTWRIHHRRASFA
jgi:ketosteroid isomerase-like protein